MFPRKNYSGKSGLCLPGDLSVHMQDVVHQPVGQEVQNIHDLFILIFRIRLMLVNKFIQFADEFLMLDLLGKDLLI